MYGGIASLYELNQQGSQTLSPILIKKIMWATYNVSTHKECRYTAHHLFKAHAFASASNSE